MQMVQFSALNFWSGFIYFLRLSEAEKRPATIETTSHIAEMAPPSSMISLAEVSLHLYYLVKKAVLLDIDLLTHSLQDLKQIPMLPHGSYLARAKLIPYTDRELFLKCGGDGISLPRSLGLCKFNLSQTHDKESESVFQPFLMGQ